MRAFVEVLGPGSGDAAAGLQLFFDDARYVFECGDGTQRYCTERSVRLGRLRGIFLTSLAAPSVGGLLGMVLTIADAGKERVTIAGPKGVSSIFAVAQRCAFCYRPAMETRMVDIDAPIASEGTAHPPTHVVCDDENVHIRAVPVTSAPRSPDASSALGSCHAALSYVCRLRDIPGKFDPKAALALGVPKGPDFGRLKRGEAIALPGGRVVQSHEVVSASAPGPLVLVVACPSVRNVGSVVTNPALCPIQLGVVDSGGNRLKSSPVCVVYHRSHRSVLADPEYLSWCRSFGAHVSHVTLHSTMAPQRIVFAAQAVDLATLRKVDAQRFRTPWPMDEESTKVPLTCCSPEKFLSSQEGIESTAWRLGDCGQQYLLAPVASSGFSDSETPTRIPDLCSSTPLAKVRRWQELALAGHEESLKEMRNPACVERFDRTTAEITFLGTAGAIPGKHRNVSGILLNLFGRGSVLFDCGEGTWGQLVRAYGPERGSSILRNMSVIFISHMHADHHLGLLTLLYEREEALRATGELLSSRELVIVGPAHLATWLDEYYTVVFGASHDKRIKFCDASTLTEPQAAESAVFAESFGLDLACVEVIHCSFSYGIVVADRVKGWSVVYSGDTRPCRALAEIGQNATLAIHEATLEDAMMEEAVDKRHSTTSEALTVCGKWMRAWRTILTHFSQRYPRVPVLDEATMTALRTHRAAIAFDMMRVNFADLYATPLIMHGVRQAFPSDNPEELVSAVQA